MIFSAKYRLAAAVLAVIMAAAIILLAQPRRILAMMTGEASEVLFYYELSQPVVALTIDDGPDSTSTPNILTVLSKHQAKATFFLISERIPGNEQLIRRMLAEGHELGNHLTREEASIRLPPESFERELQKAHAAITEFSEVRWFRPGSGWYNRQMLQTLRKYHYRLALGSVYPYDTLLPFTGFTVWHIRTFVRPGSIIVLHDRGRRGQRTSRVLEQLLPQLSARGLRVVSLSELERLAGFREFN